MDNGGPARMGGPRLRIHPAWRMPPYLGLCLVLSFGTGRLLASCGVRDPFLPALIGVSIATWLAVRYFDRERLRDLGLAWTPRTPLDLGSGLVLPPVLLSLAFAVEWAAGWLLITDVRPATPGLLLALLWRFAAVAWYEELLVRGYLLQTLARLVRPHWANILSALAFALLHLANPALTFQALFGLWFAGVFLGFCYQITGALYLPMAFHLSWNLAQALLGFPVSGTNQPGLVRLVREGPALYTGGCFGPEAGLLGFLLIALAAGTVREYAKKTRRPPR